MNSKLFALPALALSALALSFVPAPREDARPEPVRVFVVRHADRAGKADALSPAGHVRALALAEIALRQGVSAIYSTDTARTKATVRPSADALGAQIRTYAPKPPAAWFEEIAQRHAGSTILIVGHSNTVVPIVQGFGGRTSATVEHDAYHQLFVVDARAGSFSETQVVDIAFGARDVSEARRKILRAMSRPAREKAKAGSGR